MNDLTYPNRVNTLGFPILECTASIVGSNLVFTFNPHLALGWKWMGNFNVKVVNAITTGTTEEVVFATQGEQGYTPLYYYNGEPVTAADVQTTGNGVLGVFYDAANKRLQLLSIV